MRMTAEHKTFLDNLRIEGVTNMWGAAPYLVKEFGMSPNDARSVLAQWMDAYEMPKQTDEDEKDSSIIGGLAAGYMLGELLSDTSSPSFDTDSTPSFDPPDFGGGGGFDGGGAGGDF